MYVYCYIIQYKVIYSLLLYKILIVIVNETILYAHMAYKAHQPQTPPPTTKVFNGTSGKWKVKKDIGNMRINVEYSCKYILYILI